MNLGSSNSAAMVKLSVKCKFPSFPYHDRHVLQYEDVIGDPRVADLVVPEVEGAYTVQRRQVPVDLNQVIPSHVKVLL